MRRVCLGPLTFGFAALLCVPFAAWAQFNFGTDSSFGVLGATTVTNTGTTIVTGNLGVSPGSAVTGFLPGVVVGGTIHSNDATAMQAQTDLTAAYGGIAGLTCNHNLTGQDLGGLILTPGVYCFNSSAQLTGTVTLNALGNPNATFYIQIGSTLTTASNSLVSVIGGGSNCNVFWQVGSSATLGTGTNFAGNILANTSITLTTGANASGKLLARTGAVTLDTNNAGGCLAASSTPGIPIGPAPQPTVAGVPAVSTWGLLFLILALPAVALAIRRFSPSHGR
jgi:hypothetical protein